MTDGAKAVVADVAVQHLGLRIVCHGSKGTWYKLQRKDGKFTGVAEVPDFAELAAD